jgi:hypothetical protein
LKLNGAQGLSRTGPRSAPTREFSERSVTYIFQ